MGLFDNLFSRKEKVETFPEFVLGVEDIFKIHSDRGLQRRTMKNIVFTRVLYSATMMML